MERDDRSDSEAKADTEPFVRIVVKPEVGVRSGADPCGACGLSARGLVLDAELLKGERKTFVP